MEEGKPSETAVWIALNRAAHLFRDGDPKIFRDDFALPFCNLHNEAGLNAALSDIFTALKKRANPAIIDMFFPSNRAFMVIRQRYTEDGLTRSIERGVQQYVILGAGLDSFAYRRRDLENKLKVFEVDHPATQQWKKTRLKELNIDIPRNLTFVPLDFEKQTLTDELVAHGYNKDIPSFFSWLGVTCYLTEAACFQTLKEVASMARGSEIIFDYALQDSLLGDGERQLWQAGKSNPGEPAQRQFEPSSLAERLKDLGFTQVSDFGHEEANTLYLNGRTDGLSATVLDGLYVSVIRLFHIMKAII